MKSVTSFDWTYFSIIAPPGLAKGHREAVLSIPAKTYPSITCRNWLTMVGNRRLNPFNILHRNPNNKYSNRLDIDEKRAQRLDLLLLLACSSPCYHLLPCGKDCLFCLCSVVCCHWQHLCLILLAIVVVSRSSLAAGILFLHHHHNAKPIINDNKKNET